MASDITKYIPLRTIVSYFIDQYGKSNINADTCWLLGLRALTDLNFDVSAEPKTVRLPVLSNKTVALPPDYLGWRKIGVLDSGGEISTLRINNALTTWRGNNPQRLENLEPPQINDTIYGINSPNYYFNYYYQNGYAHLFGVGGGLQQYGECRVDEKNSVIILNLQFQYDSIFLEYISSPEKDADYMVDTRLQEAVIAFIEWKLKLGDEKRYYAETIKARRRLPKKSFTLQHANQVIRDAVAMKLLS